MASRRFKQLDAQGRSFQIIVLDPPAFAKNKTHYSHAMRAYKRLNAQALKMLPVGGYLLTCSCSYHVHRADFREALMQAAGEARRVVRIVREGGAASDHPILANVPETEYLKGLPAASGREVLTWSSTVAATLLRAGGRGSRVNDQRRPPSPQPLNRIRVEVRIVGYNRDLLHHGLSNQQTVKRITMRKRQRG